MEDQIQDGTEKDTVNRNIRRWDPSKYQSRYLKLSDWYCPQNCRAFKSSIYRVHRKHHSNENNGRTVSTPVMRITLQANATESKNKELFKQLIYPTGKLFHDVWLPHNCCPKYFHRSGRYRICLLNLGNGSQRKMS